MDTLHVVFTRKTINRLGTILLLILLSLSTVAAQENQAELHDNGFRYAEFNQSVLNTIEKEQEAVARLKDQRNQLQSQQQTLQAELDVYDIQLSTHQNLLAFPGTEIEHLQNASADNRKALTSIEAHLTSLQARQEEFFQQGKLAGEQITLNTNQLDKRLADPVDSPERQDLIRNLRRLLEALSVKRNLLDELETRCDNIVGRLGERKQALAALSEHFGNRINAQKKQDLFQRSERRPISAQWSQIRDELGQITLRIRRLVSGKFWIEEMLAVWKAGGFLTVSVVLLFLITTLLLVRLRRFCREIQNRPLCTEYPWRSLALPVFHRSLPLFGAALFLQVYTLLRDLDTFPIVQSVLRILWLVVSVRWGRDTLRMWNEKTPYPIPDDIRRRIGFLLLYCRGFGILYIVLDWMIIGASVLLILVRILFEAGLIRWGFGLKKLLQELVLSGDPEENQSNRKLAGLVTMMTFIIIGGGPLADLTGYGTLATYWYLSWGRTAAVLLWAGLFYQMLREWNIAYHQAADADQSADENAPSHPFRGLIFPVAWLALTIAFPVALLFAWGASQTVLVNIFKALNYSVQVGQMNLSLMNVFYAAVVLFFTHTVTRIWRFVFRGKLLAQSRMEVGLMESVTTITVYVIWTLGILIALHVFGLNTASLTVALGALGIGIGFGLQNIFSNFISGLILLFERPIQVGDDIEINGVWASVKKINFRSTVVQTYDNASLIIPNSEFVSNQVTNWSFKDRRVRRDVVVGVAYGSDIEQVRQTLLEIAQATARVLKYPKPVVLFTDFGDSALVFKLRFWTHVDYMLKVETDMRFEIDRRFREQNITIAFPQHDVHLYTMDAASPTTGDKPDPTPADDPA